MHQIHFCIPEESLEPVKRAMFNAGAGSSISIPTALGRQKALVSLNLPVMQQECTAINNDGATQIVLNKKSTTANKEKD